MTIREEMTRRRFLAGAAAMTGSIALGRPSMASARMMARDILKTMPLRDRVAQMFFFEARGTFMTTGLLRRSGAGHAGRNPVRGDNIGTAPVLTSFINGIHSSNAVIPPLICVDQEGGPVTRLAGDPAPGAVQMGALSNSDVRTLNKERAAFLAAYGFDVNFAPVADVAYDASSTMAARSFGNNPKTVAEKVSATVKGSRAGGVIGAAKHFPGHGRTQVDSHKLIPEIDVPWDEWLKTDAIPFESAIKADVDMVMLGHLRYDRIDYKPMSISKVAVRALRKDLGFNGVIVTDDLGMGALDDWKPLDIISQAVDAGIDVMLYGSPPVGWDALIDHVMGMIGNGLVDRQDINGRVEKIVALKLRHFGDRIS